MVHPCLASIVASLALAADMPPGYQLPAPPGRFVGKQTVKKGAPNAFAAGKPLVATTYFYWYDIDSGAHFVDPDGSDALTTHPATSVGMSYESVSWHRRQLQDMTAAGIDIAMPVYWGAPDGSHDWSDKGLIKLVAARSEMLDAREPAPAIGMFYDTSTLQHNRSGYHVDLTSFAGRRWFYGTIRNFFSAIPPRHRALIDGKPLVYLYGPNFAAKVDDKLFPAVREMFRRDFGTDFYLVKSAGWPGVADADYEWGAALQAKFLETAAIGAGYDHSAVPGRTPLVRDREKGAFYGSSWARLLALTPAHRPWLVHLETWNEFHEGTDLCESKEYGRKYITLTREFADLFHAGKQVSPRELSTALQAASGTPNEGDGLSVPDVRDGDGPIVKQTIAERATWTTEPNRFFASTRYLYVNLDTNFICDGNETVEVVVDYFDAGPKEFWIEYDSGDPELKGVARRFRPGGRQKIAGSNEWKTAAFTLPFARLADGSNNNDFRLVCSDGELSVARIGVRRALRESR